MREGESERAKREGANQQGKCPNSQERIFALSRAHKTNPDTVREEIYCSYLSLNKAPFDAIAWTWNQGEECNFRPSQNRLDCDFFVYG